MRLSQPRSTRTDTLFPYSTLIRPQRHPVVLSIIGRRGPRVSAVAVLLDVLSSIGILPETSERGGGINWISQKGEPKFNEIGVKEGHRKCSLFRILALLQSTRLRSQNWVHWYGANAVIPRPFSLTIIAGRRKSTTPGLSTQIGRASSRERVCKSV